MGFCCNNECEGRYVYITAKSVFRICAPVLSVRIHIFVYLLNKLPTDGSPTLERVTSGLGSSGGQPVVIMVMKRCFITAGNYFFLTNKYVVKKRR
jgi:hypothetical protein